MPGAEDETQIVLCPAPAAVRLAKKARRQESAATRGRPKLQRSTPAPRVAAGSDAESRQMNGMNNRPGEPPHRRDKSTAIVARFGKNNGSVIQACNNSTGKVMA